LPWNPDRYHQFQAQRAAPFDDLSMLVKIREGLTVIDLGCGTGELTRRLADRLPGSDTLGIDTSAEMLQRAEAHARPGLRFEKAAIETVSGMWDLVFSHAAIHWVDDHHTLIPRLYGLVRPGGQLTVQMPSNHGHATHRLITQLAGEEPFRTALGDWVRHSNVLSIEEYANLLYECGAEEITVLEKVYPHVLENADAMADWTSGTALVPYFERLSDDMQQAFMAEYRKRLRELWPGSPVFYGFRRTLFAATRPV
jgi:trans-aconitate 2-methyltransferase